jgi:hypothetical protein
MSNTSFIVISSKDKVPDSKSNTDFSYSLGQSLDVAGVAVKSISIPHTTYNINNRNNTFVVYHASISTSLTIPVGQYTSALFVLAIQEVLRTETSDSSLVVKQDTLTHKVNIKAQTVPLRISTDPISSPLGKVIGLGDKEGGTFPKVNTLNFTAPDLPDLGGVKNYYISSRTLVQSSNAVFKGGFKLPLLMSIPVTVPFGLVNHYESDDINLGIRQFSRSQNIQHIDIKILDEDLNAVDLNGADIEMTLKIYTTNSLSEIR